MKQSGLNAFSNVPIVERIDRDLESLIEPFFIGSKRDLDTMQAKLAAMDFNGLARMGHTVKGTGYGYGFKGMGDIGRDLEQAAKDKNSSTCAELVRSMEYYLENVEVQFDE